MTNKILFGFFCKMKKYLFLEKNKKKTVTLVGAEKRDRIFLQIQINVISQQFFLVIIDNDLTFTVRQRQLIQLIQKKIHTNNIDLD